MVIAHMLSEYYNGLDIYIYRPDLFEYGTTLQIVPMSNQQVMNQITCFQNNGSVNGTTTIQSLFPDLTLFTNLSSLTYARGVLVDNWSYNLTEYNRTNYYNFYVNHITGEPVQYVMFGYDSLFVRSARGNSCDDRGSPTAGLALRRVRARLHVLQHRAVRSLCIRCPI